MKMFKIGFIFKQEMAKTSKNLRNCPIDSKRIDIKNWY